MFLPGWTFSELTWSWAPTPFDFALFIFHVLQYNCGNTLIIWLKHLLQSGRENYWIDISAVSVTWLMQACIFAWSRLYLTDNIPKNILLPQRWDTSVYGWGGWYIPVLWKIHVRELFQSTFHIYRIGKEWPITEVKDWKGNAGVIYSISSSCSQARISWEMVVIPLLKNLPVARVSELS